MREIQRSYSQNRPNQNINFPHKRRPKSSQPFTDSSNYNRSLIEAALDPLVAIGLDGKISDVNSATEKITGCSRKELIGADFSDFFTEPEEARRGYQQVIREGRVENFVLEVRHREGWVTPVLYNATVYKNNRGETAGVFAAARDITEQKRAREALQELNQALEQKVAERTQALVESEQRFKAVTVHTPDHILVQDRNLRYLLVVNPQLGLTEQDMLGKTDFDFLAQEDAEKLTQIKRQVMETGQQVNLATLVSSKQGAERFFEGSYVPKRDENGKVDGLFGYFRDITEQKKTEAELARLASFPELNTSPILEINLSGGIEYSNPSARRLFPDLVEKSARHPFITGWPEMVGQIRKDPARVITREVQVDGQVYQQSIYYVKAYDRMRFYGMDISERVRAEKALTVSQSLLRSVMEGTTDQIYLKDRESRFLLANAATLEVLGKPLEKVIGKNDKELQDDPSVAMTLMENDRRIIESGETQVIEEVLKRDGKNRIYLSTKTPYRNAEGNVIGVIGVARDITERRAREKELTRLNRTLRALSNINQAMLRAENEAGYMKTVCDIIVEDCGHPMVWIGFVEHDENKSIRPVASAGFDFGYLHSLQLTWADTIRGQGPGGTAIRTGKTQICKNMLTDPQFESWRDEAVKRGYASSVVLPLLINEVVFGELTIYSREPDPFSEYEISLLTELASDLAYGISLLRLRQANVEAEKALKRSEERYRSLFTGMSEGFVLNEILCDANGKPVDYRLLEMNPAFEHLTGLERSQIEGMLKRFVLPGGDSTWLDLFGKVALTGEPVHYESYFSTLNQYFEVDSYCPAPGQFAVLFRNVTETKKNQERLFLQAHLLDTIGQGVAAVDLQGNVTYWNQAAGQLFGWQVNEILGQSLVKLILPDNLATRAQFDQVRAAMAKGENWSGETSVKRREGSLFPVLVTLAPIREGEGPITGISGIFTDLTERKQIEEELRQSERLYRGIGESIDYGVWVCAPDGRNIYASDSFLKLVGLTQQQCSDFGWGDVLHPEDRERTITAWKECVRSGSNWDIEHRFRGMDGQYHAILARGVPIRDEQDEIIRWAGINLDISSIKQAEAERDRALEEVQRRAGELDAVFNSIADGVMLTGPSGEILKLNPAAQRILEYSPQQMNLPVERRAQIIHPITMPGIPLLGEGEFPISRALKGELVRNMVLSITSESGRQTWISASAAPFQSGKNLGAVLSFTDVTERMHMVEQLRQARDELEMRVQERTTELTATLSALRESEERFRQLTENIREVFILFTPGKLIPTYVSPAYVELVGREPNISALDPYSFLDSIYAEDRPDVGTFLHMISQGRFDQQYRMVRQDGSLRWVRARGFPVHNNQGELYRVAAIIEDVTREVEAYQNLEQRVEERTRELSTLLSYSEELASTLELRTLMKIMLDQLVSVVDYDGAAILLLDGDELFPVEYLGQMEKEEVLKLRFSAAVSPGLSKVVQTRSPVIIEDLQGGSEEAREFRKAILPINNLLLGQARSWLGVPLIVKNQLMGILRLSHSQPNRFNIRQAQLVAGVANQAAMAIENAQLFSQARQLAALAERQRLARELHDSISQALYGISLGAHTAIALANRNPKKLEDALKYILSLAEIAHTEMRALIFELRPDTLETEGLVKALNRQAEALQSRRGISVKSNLCDEVNTTLEMKEALYRIAQEAMQNAVKHASPSEINLQLFCSEKFIEMVIIDNGIGFDPNQSFPGHLGLRSMSERAASLGGSLVIDSTPGVGTSVRVRLPL